ncbi:FmdB family zinc ribbon protein [Caballeronia sp. ATUFL_M1_KS5A]|uniref:FmdB family zinc ribbon protein n=1 Tax=Caballeronia sp. ATUFL_M1_KS5A TaxID=2921778 RepID=UPI002027DB42|nr:FmdB family zinc ribbon protein [Caballeronia sp. ATUFL_M1_KS5A]
MPIYATQCRECGHEDTIYRAVAERDRDIPTCDCGGRMERIVTAPYVAADMQPYQSMIDGSWITSRSRHNAHLKAHGCIEVGNEVHHLKAKQKPELSKESRAARKQTIIEQVNALK